MKPTADLNVLWVACESSTPLFRRLSEAIKTVDKDIHITAAGLMDTDGNPLDTGESYGSIDRCLSLDLTTRKNTISGLFRSIFKRRAIYVSLLFGLMSRVSKFDVVNVQGLFKPKYLVPIVIACRLKKVPIVITCWGSDIYRVPRLQTLLYQRYLVNRSDAITASGVEFGEVILAKFGQEHRDKLRRTYFPIGIEPFLECDVEQLKQEFRKQHNIDDDAIIAMLGHNGSPANQHFEQIQQLKADSAVADKLFVVVPMTYGGPAAYCDEVRQALGELNGIVLDQFLSESDLVGLYAAIDIMIYTPISDAFSASVSQALATGTTCIVGSWLPYKARVRAGFLYKEVDELNDLAMVLAEELHAWPPDTAIAEQNRAASAKFLKSENLARSWIEVYRSLTED